MPDTDPATSALEEIREHNERVIALCDMAPARVQQLAEHDVPRLLEATETALAFHEESGGNCGSCLDAYGDRIEWPCEEYTAITAALAGKQLSEDGDHDRPA